MVQFHLVGIKGEKKMDMDMEGRIIEASEEFPFPCLLSPPCRLEREDGKMIEASHSVSAGYPDGNGGGILFWAYSEEAAKFAHDFFVGHGYKHVKIEKEPISEEKVHSACYGKTITIQLEMAPRGNGCGRPLCNGNNGNECICRHNPYC